MLITLSLQKQKDGSVIAYDDKGNQKCHWAWWHSSKPDRRFKYVMYNCYKWAVVWLDDVI